ncbi:37S ribosomal protein MRP4 [Ophiocordyceps camponoti-floridani]|uniref:37S ribosomal protein MRP4 n=1 Tax=Ophiocordyceps camponoti-floridani TaxID=2030778 RepID=A0A8H4Q7P6_9HYPO|nr:37S ribosomal protein MRP4 [Ophiocordyceps camponoti-floridani]
MLPCAALRNGRSTLAPALARSALRRASTEAGTSKKPVNASDIKALNTNMRSNNGAPRLPNMNKKRKEVEAQDGFTSLAAGELRKHQGESWTRSHQVGDMLVTPAQQYAFYQRIRWQSRGLGSEVSRRYHPSQHINNPPWPEDVTLELLMASQTHMGHHTSLWNPANSRYIYGIREGIHIISLEATMAHLRRAVRVMEGVLYRGGIVLFVGNRPGHMEIVVKAAELAGGYYLFNYWKPGGITNRDAIFKLHRMKVVDHLDREIRGFENYLDVARPVLPSLVVCLNPLENAILLHECNIKHVPTIGIIDTDADPSWVTYPIPCNDDSLRAMAVICGTLGRAGQRGTKQRLEESAEGRVTWSTPPEILRHMKKEIGEAQAMQRQVIKMMQDDEVDFNDEEMKILRSGRAQTGGVAEVKEEEMLDVLSQASGGRAAEAAAEAAAIAAAAVDEVLTGETAAEEKKPPSSS